MFDCSSEITRFHDEKVTLPEEVRKKLRKHRQANQDRLTARLKESEDPIPFDFVQQGSYAMHTMTQHPENDYDIDDGALFKREDLGESKTPRAAKEMVCDALQDDRFDKQPEIHTNCVRVYYAEGHHVDIPVYRTKVDGSGYELASTEWKHSDPDGVTKWFKNSSKAKTDGGAQMRQLVRSLKKFGKSRESWNMPSGLIITVLVNERYSTVVTRLDEALYNVMSSIKQRLDFDKSIRHPVVDESLSDKCKSAVEELNQRLEWALEELSVLKDADCTRLKALKAWKKVLNTDFFNSMIDEESQRAAVKSFYVSSGTPTEPVDKVGGGRAG